MCGLKWGHPASEGTAISRVLDSPGSASPLLDSPDGRNPLGPFTLDRLPSEVPSSAIVQIDLKTWHSHSRSKLDDDLRALIIPHRWEGDTLDFIGAQLPQVVERIRSIIEEVEPTFDEAELLHLDVGDLSSGAVDRLRRTLDSAQLPFRIAAGDLEVSEPDRDRVDRILNDLRATDTSSPEAPNRLFDDANDEADPGEAVAFASLDSLYEAVDDLRRHPASMSAADHLADVCARCPIGPPYGLEPELWHDLVAEAGTLAGATSDLDDEATRNRSTSLYNRLRDIIA